MTLARIKKSLNLQSFNQNMYGIQEKLRDSIHFDSRFV